MVAGDIVNQCPIFGKRLNVDNTSLELGDVVEQGVLHFLG